MIFDNFAIRTAVKDDIDAVMEIENESFAKGIQENRQTFSERIDTFSDGFLVLADENNLPVGYISSEIWTYKEQITKEDFALEHSIKDKHNNLANELYISSMALSNKLTGKRLGHLLFDYLIDNITQKYPNIKSFILVVCVDWKQAQRIYKNKGFKEICTLKNFFELWNNSNSDGIIMRQSLK